MTIKVAICDDIKEARYILRRYLDAINIDELEVIGEAENGFELIEICKKTAPDFILLDIDMPIINGIDTAKMILELIPNISIIFTTAYINFAIDSFEVYPIDYIVKPIDIKRLEKSIKYIINKRYEINKKKAIYLILYQITKYIH